MKMVNNRVDFELLRINEELQRAQEMGPFKVDYCEEHDARWVHIELVDSILEVMYLRGEINQEELIYTNRETFDVEAHYAKLAGE